MNRRRLLTGAAALLAAGLAGCGIPDQTDVRVDGGGQARGTSTDDDQHRQPPSRTDSGEDPVQFVLNYLQAAAGETTGAYDRVRRYVATRSLSRLVKTPGQEVAINVVRVTEPPRPPTNDPNGTISVTVSVQHVGVLRSNGSLDPPVERKAQYEFQLSRADPSDVRPPRRGTGFYLTNPEAVLLMSTEALEQFYDSRPIYFWSRDGRSLVPDLRYLPVAVPEAGRATEMLGWLLDGPADWLKSTVAGLPAGTKAIGNVIPQPSGRLMVNLSVDSALTNRDWAPDRLATQLVWSLGDALTGNALELVIKDRGSRVIDVEMQRRMHPVYQVDGSPQRFCVYNGSVRRLREPGDPAGGPVPIAREANRNVVSAAFIRDRGPLTAALVVTVNGRHSLRVGSSAETIERFDGDRAFAQMSRPVWLKTPVPSEPVGLVVADGRLYRFGPDAVLTQVPGVVDEVTAVAAGLDGHRIAFIRDGRLYVAGLTVEGRSVTVGPPRQLPTSLRDLTAVEWIGENDLVVAGVTADGRGVALYEISVDGAVERTVVDELGGPTVTHIAAYPRNPVHVLNGGGRPMYVANGVAYNGSPNFEITPDQVEGVDLVPDTNPTAPFFLY